MKDKLAGIVEDALSKIEKSEKLDVLNDIKNFLALEKKVSLHQFSNP